MKKRNIVNEITSIKSRTEFNPSMVFEQRLDDIYDALQKLLDMENPNKELLKYIPISIVACFEAFFQNMIKLLIDNHKQYYANIVGFDQSKNVKLDFQVLAAIQSKTLTVGEFVAHLLPYNNLEDIASNIKTVTGEEFLTELKKFSQKPGPPYLEGQWQKYRDKPGIVINGVNRTFELRHIFCHEFATNIDIKAKEIAEIFDCCHIFLTLSFRYLYSIVYPSSSGNPKYHTLQAIKEFTETDAVLHVVIKKIVDRIYKSKSHEEWNVALFKDSIRKWRKYRDSRAIFKSDGARGLDFYELWLIQEKIKITREKIISLEEEFGEVLGRSPRTN